MKTYLGLALGLACTLTVRATEFQVATNGADTADGTAAHPFRTIQHALDALSKPGDAVTVMPGMYAEELSLRTSGTPDKPILLKAAQKQTVILDGAQRVRGWQRLEAAHDVWGLAFGSPAPYHNDQGRWDLPPRSEQVFVDGQRCTHLKDDTAPAALADYAYTATLTDPARYALKLPHGLDPNLAMTEVTVKASLLTVRADHVVIDGLVFRRARNTYQQAMVTLHGEGVEFRHNLLEYSSAGSGLAIQTHGAQVHDNTFRHNGQFGFSLGGGGNVIENNLVQGNDLAGYKEWGTGGTKIVGSGNQIRRNRFIDNLGGVAIWLDCGPANNVIEYNYVSGNYGEGIRAEISYHSLIAYNIVEHTKPCTSTMFGRTQTHCVGISVQNSAETCVVHNFLKDNYGVGIQLATYNRKAADLSKWQERRADAPQKAWLRRSWADGFVYAYSNLFFNNVVVQNTPETAGACVFQMGLFNGQKPHCYGNQFDCNFYWNSVTHAPQVQAKNVTEVPDGKSAWQTRYGMDVHALGGFTPEAYRQPAFGADYPYPPAATFAGLGKGRDLKDLPWPLNTDYVGNKLSAGHPPSIGHIEQGGSGGK